MADKLNASEPHYEVRAGGIPCYVTGTVCRAEPDVGIFHDWFEPDALYTLKGHRALWLESQMNARDWDSIVDQVMKQVGG